MPSRPTCLSLQALPPSRIASSLHPHDHFSAVAATPLGFIADLPEDRLVAALSTHITAPRAADAAPCDNCRSDVAAACFASGSVPSASSAGPPAHGATLNIRNTPCCAAARILHHTPRLRVPLRGVSLHCTATPSAYPPCIRSKTPCGRREVVCCANTGDAIATALSAHADTLQHLALCGVSLTMDGARALGCVLPRLRLRSLELHSVNIDAGAARRRAFSEFAAAVHVCSGLTRLSISWTACAGNAWIGTLALSNFPHLRSLSAASEPPRHAQEWLSEHSYLEHLSELEELAVDLSRQPRVHRPAVPLHETLCTHIAARLRECTSLRRLSGASVGLLQQLYRRAAGFPRLTAMHVRIARAERVDAPLPHSWLRMCPWAQMLSIIADRDEAGEPVVKVDVADLASRMATLTQLELQGVGAVHGGADLTSDAFARVLAARPHLKVLQLRAIQPVRAMQPVPAKQPPVTDAQRRWLHIFDAPQTPPAPAVPLGPPSMTPALTALCTLDLSCNHLASGFWRGLLDCATASPHLTRVHLSDNGLGDDLRAARGAPRGPPRGTEAPWLTALAHLPALRRVVLTWNGIDDEGALRVLRALRAAPELEAVDLRCNSIVDLPPHGALGEMLARTQAGTGAQHGMAGGPGAREASAAMCGPVGEEWWAKPCGPDAAEVLTGVPTLDDIDCAV